MAYNSERLLEEQGVDPSKLPHLLGQWPVVWINVVSRGALKPAIDGRFKTSRFQVDVVDLTSIVGLLQDKGR